MRGLYLLFCNFYTKTTLATESAQVKYVRGHEVWLKSETTSDDQVIEYTIWVPRKSNPKCIVALAWRIFLRFAYGVRL